MRVSFIAYLILSTAFAPAVRGAPVTARRAQQSTPPLAKRVEGDSTRAPEYFIVVLADGTNVRSHLSWVSAVLVANGAAPIQGVPLMPAPGDGNPPEGGAPMPSPGDGNPPSGGAPTPGNPPEGGAPIPGNPPAPTPNPGDGNPPEGGAPTPGNPPNDGGNPPNDGAPTPNPGDGNPPDSGPPTPSPGDGVPDQPPSDGSPAPAPGAPGAPGNGAPAAGPVDDLPAADETDPDYGGGGVVPCPGNATPLTSLSGPIDASDAYISGFVGVGYWGYFPAGLIDVIKANADVLEVWEDSTAEIAVVKGRTVTPHSSTPAHTVTQSPAPWQLARLSSRVPDRTKIYHYNSLGGANVTMHIIDSGIQTAHSEFGGRASMVWAAHPYPRADENGHGTFVAALAAGATYGAAKGATVLGYRVVDKTGAGFASDLMAAVHQVTLYARQHNGSHVINLSLALPRNGAVDRAVSRAARLGIHVVAAAGNGAADVDGVSPARSAGAISVGASTLTDRAAAFSNVGADVYAPGEGVESATLGASTRATTLSGTSMAAPLVAGVIAVELSVRGPQRPADIASWVLKSATPNAVTVKNMPRAKLVFNCWNEHNDASGQPCWDFVNRTASQPPAKASAFSIFGDSLSRLAGLSR